ncbi:response regulator [Deltaproteobacteria bacterium]|nr:response regulator [Deltaproteobacteria bacterium]
MEKILIVDDQVEIRELIVATLRDEDYQIIQAKSGEEAVEIARLEKPDLIIMDVMMPGSIDGMGATRIIKDDPEIKDCRIVLLTGKAQQDDMEEGYRIGADDYFLKPFSPIELIKKVKDMLA